MSDTPTNEPKSNPVLSPAENAMLHHAGVDPSAYGALVAQAQVDGRQMMAMGQVQTPEGLVDCLIVPLVMFVPLHQLAPRAGLLDTSGHPPNPVEGMVPVVSVRAVLPIARLQLRPKLVVPEWSNSGFPE
jgi:hypothetical protein